MTAALYAHEGVVELLLAQPEILVDLVDDEGRSALMLAGLGRREAILGLLLAILSINTTTRAADGHTAMLLALANGHVGIVQLFEGCRRVVTGAAVMGMDAGGAIGQDTNGEGAGGSHPKLDVQDWDELRSGPGPKRGRFQGHVDDLAASLSRPLWFMKIYLRAWRTYVFKVLECALLNSLRYDPSFRGDMDLEGAEVRVNGWKFPAPSADYAAQ
ncbi:hypothetical protein BKA70DRAFT_1236583 [Coprinopsis sp. MPI-PUGE-AT-0042]|nr:hypothetical protein BKA70DRAFT_1236583 [Coprinopsis sp. MPI-PUGE-AT-0042]